MTYIQVKSFKHLDELLQQGYTEFLSRCGVLSCSRYITPSCRPSFDYEVFSYVDGSSIFYTRQELSDTLSPIITSGHFYAEK